MSVTKICASRTYMGTQNLLLGINLVCCCYLVLRDRYDSGDIIYSPALHNLRACEGFFLIFETENGLQPVV